MARPRHNDGMVRHPVIVRQIAGFLQEISVHAAGAAIDIQGGEITNTHDTVLVARFSILPRPLPAPGSFQWMGHLGPWWNGENQLRLTDLRIYDEGSNVHENAGAVFLDLHEFLGLEITQDNTHLLQRHF